MPRIRKFVVIRGGLRVHHTALQRKISGRLVTEGVKYAARKRILNLRQCHAKKRQDAARLPPPSHNLIHIMPFITHPPVSGVTHLYRPSIDCA